MTKMATMSIYGENTLKVFFSRTVSQMTLKLGKKQKRLELYKSYINVIIKPWIDLDLFYDEVEFGP